MRTTAIVFTGLLTACHVPEKYVSSQDAVVDADAMPDVTPDAMDIPWDVEPPAGGCPPGWTCRNSQVPELEGVDILVVVDDSKSMADEQLTMAEQFPIIIHDLLDPELDPVTGRPRHVPVTDLHVGVVSTDMGTAGYTVPTCPDRVDGEDGVLQHDPSPMMEDCLPSYPSFLPYDEESPDPELVEEMSGAFGCIATLGTDGCGFEQQLEAARKALVEHAVEGGPNAGFLRDDSVLMIIWLTDEEDCSVSNPDIFDPDDPSLGHLNLRCFNHPEMVHDVERYVGALRGLRSGSPWPVLLGMIVGVPPDEERCNGFGDRLEGCLDVELMQERLDPADDTTLVPSCDTVFGRAYPPRRFVQMARSFGDRAYVHSICQDDYEPAMSALSQSIGALADLTCEASIVELTKSPSNPCVCTSECRVVHVLADDTDCPPALAPWDHDGDTVPDEVLDADGAPVTACEVPAATTRVMSCDRSCHDPHQGYQPDGEGWFYHLSYSGVACPSVAFTPSYGPPPGATTFVACP
jgi:hypothetical protein